MSNWWLCDEKINIANLQLIIYLHIILLYRELNDTYIQKRENNINRINININININLSKKISVSREMIPGLFHVWHEIWSCVWRQEIDVFQPIVVSHVHRYLESRVKKIRK